MTLSTPPDPDVIEGDVMLRYSEWLQTDAGETARAEVPSRDSLFAIWISGFSAGASSMANFAISELNTLEKPA